MPDPSTESTPPPEQQATRRRFSFVTDRLRSRINHRLYEPEATYVYKVVRRTNALTDSRYGADFRYDEAVLCGAGPGGFAKAAGQAVGQGAMMGAAGFENDPVLSEVGAEAEQRLRRVAQSLE